MLRPSALAALLSLAAVAPSHAATLTGAWGGAGVALNATATSADLQADCAHGRIDGPLSLDASGGFSGVGSYETYHAGPQQADEPGTPPTATFAGRIKGETLELTVISKPSGERIHYVLTRGARPVLVRCY